MRPPSQCRKTYKTHPDMLTSVNTHTVAINTQGSIDQQISSYVGLNQVSTLFRDVALPSPVEGTILEFIAQIVVELEQPPTSHINGTVELWAGGANPEIVGTAIVPVTTKDLQRTSLYFGYQRILLNKDINSSDALAPRFVKLVDQDGQQPHVIGPIKVATTTLLQST